MELVDPVPFILEDMHSEVTGAADQYTTVFYVLLCKEPLLNTYY